MMPAALYSSACIGAFMCAMALAGCMTVGPNYIAPSAYAPHEWKETSSAVPGSPKTSGYAEASRIDTRSDPDSRWWRSFNDPVLDRLIVGAITGNLDLQQAVLRIAASRAQEQGVGAAGLPIVSAKASYNRNQLGVKGLLDSGTPDQQAVEHSLVESVTPSFNFLQAGFDASWELDLFGRVRRSVEGAGAQTQAAIESGNSALVSLEAEVAQTYVRLRGAQATKHIVVRQTEVEQQIVDLIRNRRDSGLASDVDVERASAQVSVSESQVPQVDQQIAQALNALSTLVGEPPGTLDAELSKEGAVPPVPPEVPIGLPATLARRRPDIREAEAQLHVATANTGVAVASLFPDVSLTGAVGTYGIDGNYLTRWSDHFFSIGPNISLPIFQGGALIAGVKMARARQASAALQYRKVVLQALQEVENALATYRTDQATRASLARVEASDQRSLDLTRNGHGNGLVSFIDVLNDERQLAQSRQQLTRMTLQVSIDLVSLYKALGGGWQSDEAQGGVQASAQNPPHDPQAQGVAAASSH